MESDQGSNLFDKEKEGEDREVDGATGWDTVILFITCLVILRNIWVIMMINYDDDDDDYYLRANPR